MNYDRWNGALGNYFFNPQNSGRSITLYLDRRRIDEIGLHAGLGGWNEFLAAVKDGDGDWIGKLLYDPISHANHLANRWLSTQRLSNLQRKESLTYPPMLVGLAILVLAWTEDEHVSSRGYYASVRRFCKSVHPENHRSFPRFIRNVQELIRSIAELAEWLSKNYGTDRGTLLVRRISSYPYVGAIRFHALLEPKERAALPLLWNEVVGVANSNIPASRLLKLASEAETLHRHLPNLAKLMSRGNTDDRKFIEALILEEYLSWDGSVPHGQATQKSKPESNATILMRFDNKKPSKVYVHSHVDLGVLRENRTDYQMLQEDEATLWTLVYADNGLPVIPDENWLFGEIELQGDHGNVRRKRRDYFWLCPSTTLGFQTNGFLEVKSPRLEGPFRLVARGKAVDQIRAWIQNKHAVSTPKLESLSDHIFILSASHPRTNPFDKQAVSEQADVELWSLADGGKNRSGAFQGEMPPSVIVDSALGTRWDIEANPQGTRQQELRFVRLDDHRASIYSTPLPPHGEYDLRLSDEQGCVIGIKKLRLELSEPLVHRNVDRSRLLSRHGEWENTTQYEEQSCFLGNRFSRPIQPSALPITRFLIPDQSSEIPLISGLDLGFQLVAATQDDGHIAVSDWHQILNKISLVNGLAPASKGSNNLLRQKMESLGFFHNDYQRRRLMVAPLTLCLLPDNVHSIRALLLGPIPAIVLEFLIDWCQRENRGIRFQWILQRDPMIPPILQLATFNMQYLVSFCEAINQHFPDSVVLESRQSLALSILQWHAPLPPTPPFHAGHKPDWQSFSHQDLRWNIRRCAFERGGLLARFPVLTVVEDDRTKRKSWTWWEDIDSGYDVKHFNTIAALHNRHGFPLIAQNAEKTDQILVAGLPYLSPLIERALVLATGHLPELVRAGQISAWKDKFDPSAIWRLFSGIKPALRKELWRIYAAALKGQERNKFPQVVIHENSI